MTNCSPIDLLDVAGRTFRLAAQSADVVNFNHPRHMKKTLRFALTFLALATFAVLPCPAAESASDKASSQKISSIIGGSAAKVNKLDVEGALKHVHPTAYSEYTHLPQKALVAIDKKTLLEVCKAIFPSLRIRVGPPQNLKVVVKGDMAYATYESNERIGDGPPMMVRRTEIFVRENKEWLLTHSHRSILQGE